jgi:hypothetical protein
MHKHLQKSQRIAESKKRGWTLESETPLNELQKITANDKICVCFQASIITSVDIPIFLSF